MMTKSRSSSSIVNPAFESALMKHVDGLSLFEKEAFEAAYNNITPDDLYLKTRKHDDKHREETLFRRCTPLLEKFFTCIDRFMGGVAIGIQAYPDISCLVVGAIRIAIDVSNIL